MFTIESKIANNFLGGWLFIGVGHYEIKLPIYIKFIEKNNYTHTNGMLENRLVHIY